MGRSPIEFFLTRLIFRAKQIIMDRIKNKKVTDSFNLGFYLTG
jgi:hypothetical protein